MYMLFLVVIWMHLLDKSTVHSFKLWLQCIYTVYTLQSIEILYHERLQEMTKTAHVCSNRTLLKFQAI